MAFRRFNPLNVPEHWERYFTKYPQGMTILESLFEWVSQVDSMVENVNEWNEYLDNFVKTFDKELQETITKILMEWQASGFLDIVISEALQTEIDTVREDLEGRGVNVKKFGAIGDGVHDDRPSIQATIDYVSQGEGGRIVFPEGLYLLKSKHPTVDAHLLLDHPSVTFEGAGELVAKLQADIQAETMVLIGTEKSTFGEISRTNIFDIGFEGKNHVKHNIKGTKKYLPFLNMARVFANEATESNYHLSPYMANFTNVTGQFSKHAFNLIPLSGNILTSISFNSCYANAQSVSGFKTENMNYSVFNACGVDNSPLGFHLYNSKGVTLNGVAAENTEKLAKFSPFFGITVSGFFSMYGGNAITANPTPHLIEFGYGTNATISGVELQNMKNYTNVLGLTDSAWGLENITVLDDSIKRNQTTFVKNNRFDRPIKFLRNDETLKDRTVNVAIADFPQYMRDLQDTEINHELIIQLADGTQPTISNTTYQNLISRLKGMGKVTIQGNSLNRDSVRLHGSWQQFLIKNTSVTIELKNLTVEARNSGGVGFNLIETNNARKVILNNVHLSANELNVGSAVKANNGSEVYISNGTNNTGDFVGTVYNPDQTSRIQTT